MTMRYKICPTHGLYVITEGRRQCPKCGNKEINKKSDKYGNVSIHIPPGMRAAGKDKK